MTFDLKNFLYVFIVSIFFIHFNLPFVHFYAVIGLVLLFISFLLLLIFRYKSFISFIQKVSLNKHNSFRVYLLYLIYIISITLIFGVLGKVNIASSFAEIFYRNVVCMLACYVTVAYIVFKYMSERLLIKIFYGVLFIILSLGIVDFFAYILHITPIEWFLKQIHNLNVVVWLQGQGQTEVHSHAMVGNLPRAQSIYVEPGFFAENIFLFLPILYHLSLCKYKIFNNKYINSIIKKTTIPLVWINLILTFSPIWLVGCIISTAIYFHKKIFLFFKKNKICILITVFMVFILFNILCFMKIDLSNTYLSRIEKVYKNFTNIESLIEEEPSLGTRLSSVLNQVYIGFSKPIFGHGNSNKAKLVVDTIARGQSPIPPTGEMIHYILQVEKPRFHSPPVADTFIRYGIIGIILYFGFIIKTILLLKKARRCTNPLTKCFLSGIGGALISYIVLCWYDITPAELQSCLLIGISIAIIQKYSTKSLIKKKEIDDANYGHICSL